MTPAQAAYAKKNNFSDHLPRQRQVWKVERILAYPNTCAARLEAIVASGGHVFQVNSLGNGWDIVWYSFED